MIERETQLAALMGYAAEAGAGHGRLVLVAGEAGVGKSTLVDHLRGALQDAAPVPAVDWLWGACDGLFTPRPLGPMHDLAEQAGGELAELSRAGASRDELFAGLLRRIRTESGPDKLSVYVVEDVHWADEATLDLVQFVGRRLRDAHAMVVLTYREEGLTPGHPLLTVLGELASTGTTRRVTLGPLSPSGVAALADGHGLDSDEVFRLTGGNPFYVNEILEAQAPGIPPSARDAALARTVSLDADARAALDVAALLGMRVDPALLATVAGVQPAVLDSLLASGVLVSEPPAMRFRHEIARRAVQEAIPPHRLAATHRRILDVLLAVEPAAEAADDAALAYHSEGAGDAALVLRFAPRAGDRAAAALAHREAGAQFARALRFADGQAPAERAHIAWRLAREESLVDRWDSAADHGCLALEQFRAAGLRECEGQALVFLSKVMRRLCRGDAVVSYAEEAVALGDGFPGTLLQAMAWSQLAQARMIGADLDDAERLARRAQDLAVALDLPGVRSDAMNTEALVAATRGLDWEPMMREALRIASAAGLEEPAGRAFANLHFKLSEAHRYEETDAVYAEGYAYCEDHDMATFGTCLRNAQGEALMQRGRWDEGLGLCRASLGWRSISPLNRITACLTVGIVLARRGDPAAMGYLDEAIANAVTCGEPLWLRETLPVRAEARWLAGDIDAARRDLLQAVGDGAPADVALDSRISLWLQRIGEQSPYPFVAESEPERLAMTGDWAGAAQAWDRMHRPYEAALALVETEQDDLQREGLRRLDAFGAVASARVARRALRARGVRGLPAGPRTTTAANPAGLTARELDVLRLVSDGLTNDEIAARLFIAGKTVDHHVSSVLGKLGVTSRREAAREADRLGILTQVAS